jgi:hypothetical protein
MTNKDMTITVYPPGRLLFIDTYIRDLESGKKRYAFHLEVPKHGKTMRREDFRRAAKSILKTDKFTAPRTRPIRDVQEADRLLALWTPRRQTFSTVKSKTMRSSLPSSAQRS